MCAGKSTRTYPLTLTRPKPLLKIANKCILQHNLEQLKELKDINEVILIVGYKREMIELFIAENKDQFDFQINLVVQEKQLGTADALNCVKEDIGDEKFLLMNGDDLFFAEDLKNLVQANNDHAILVHKVEDPTQYGIIEQGENNLIKNIVEKPKQNIGNLANAGAYVFSKEIFNSTAKESERGELELIDMIIDLCKQGKVNYIEAQSWFPITYPWDLLKANAFLMSTIKKKIQGEIEDNVQIKGEVIIGKGTTIKSGVYIEGPVVVGENCIVGPNAYLRPNTVVGDNCKIGHEVEVKNSIVFDKSKIPHLNYLGDSVIGEDVNLAAGTITANVRHDKQLIRSSVKDELIETGLGKLGTIIGDNVKLGIRTIIYPGRKIWPEKTTLPGEIVKKDVQ